MSLRTAGSLVSSELLQVAQNLGRASVMYTKYREEACADALAYSDSKG